MCEIISFPFHKAPLAAVGRVSGECKRKEKQGDQSGDAHPSQRWSSKEESGRGHKGTTRLGHVLETELMGSVNREKGEGEDGESGLTP